VLNVVRREVEVMAETDRVPDRFEIDLGAAKVARAFAGRRSRTISAPAR
jgi:hypothetical protein